MKCQSAKFHKTSSLAGSRLQQRHTVIHFNYVVVLSDEATTSATPVDDDVLTIAMEIWSDLEASPTVESPFLVKPF
jgi:hypothetical protein